MLEAGIALRFSVRHALKPSLIVVSVMAAVFAIVVIVDGELPVQPDVAVETSPGATVDRVPNAVPMTTMSDVRRRVFRGSGLVAYTWRSSIGRFRASKQDRTFRARGSPLNTAPPRKSHG